MKIAFFEIEKWEQDYVAPRLVGNEVLFFPDPAGQKNIAEANDCEIISPFIYSKINAETLSQLPLLKFIATRSTGFDHIDLADAKNKKITVSNVPSYGENTVAEHTFALILSLSRKIPESAEETRRGGFSTDGLQGFDLKGKTLGIIGMGNIGQRVARIAKGFEMEVLAYDIEQDKKTAKNFGFKYAGLEELLANSDIITLHAPYNKSTHHLINSQNINLIKKGAYLINTARGGLVETSALAVALGTGILAGAGLDVLEEECFIKEEAELLSREFPKTCDLKTILQNHILLEQKNVIVTPHNAFNSKEAVERILDSTVENVLAFIKNKPVNTVK